MTDLEKKALFLYRQLPDKDKAFVAELARMALKAQEEGKPLIIPTIQKKEAEA